MKAIVGIAIGIGLFVYGSGVPARQEPAGKPSTAPSVRGEPKAVAPGKPASEYAWRRTGPV